MKTRQYIITLLAGVGSLALVACSPKNEKTPANTSARDAMDSAAQTAGNAMNRAGDAIETTWDNIKDATYDKRTDVQASLNSMSTSVDQKINELQARSASASDTAKKKLEAGLEELRKARTNLREEIADLGNATAETWNQAKAEVASAWDRVHEAYSKLES